MLGCAHLALYAAGGSSKARHVKSLFLLENRKRENEHVLRTLSELHRMRIRLSARAAPHLQPVRYLNSRIS